jgi:hypothetical protein
VRVRTKASLLWGSVAAFSFLVLAQGYNLIGNEPITIGMMVGVALLVGIIASVISQMADAE